MSPGPDGLDEIDESFPRVSGDEPRCLRGVEQMRRFSPRERG